MPYFGYARQEKKDRPREAITAKLIADVLTAAGADRVIALDLHADAIQGFFNIPLDHLTARGMFADCFEQKHLENVVIVSPDEGRVKQARKLVRQLNAPLAVGYKHHEHHGHTEITDLAGDVKGKIPIILEDMITTGGSIIECVDALFDMARSRNLRRRLAWHPCRQRPRPPERPSGHRRGRYHRQRPPAAGQAAPEDQAVVRRSHARRGHPPRQPGHEHHEFVRLKDLMRMARPNSHAVNGEAREAAPRRASRGRKKAEAFADDRPPDGWPKAC